MFIFHFSYYKNTLFNHFSSLFDSGQVPANQGWGDGPLPSRVAADASFTVQSAFLSNSVLGHLENVHPDNSKAPGFRPPSQRVSTSPVGKSLSIIVTKYGAVKTHLPS